MDSLETMFSGYVETQEMSAALPTSQKSGKHKSCCKRYDSGAIGCICISGFWPICQRYLWGRLGRRFCRNKKNDCRQENKSETQQKRCPSRFHLNAKRNKQRGCYKSNAHECYYQAYETQGGCQSQTTRAAFCVARGSLEQGFQQMVQRRDNAPSRSPVLAASAIASHG